jgi:hypothetical protein
VWAKIISGEYKDDKFHGLEFFVECLAKYVWYHKLIPKASFIFTYVMEVTEQIYYFINYILCSTFGIFILLCPYQIENYFSILFLQDTVTF